MFGIKRMTKQEIRVARKMGPFITVFAVIVMFLTYMALKLFGRC
ncbi:Uncharacterised protein [uncultured archaeon]|nr:Uncharacterised protein [uncultured archaeon]